MKNTSPNGGILWNEAICDSLVIGISNFAIESRLHNTDWNIVNWTVVSFTLWVNVSSISIMFSLYHV